MEEQPFSPLEKCLLELLNPSTTPENALQSLSSPWFSSAAFSTDGEEPVVIFLAYLRYIITKQPEAFGSYVDGIWEEILWKVLQYSKNFSRCSRYFSRSTLDIYVALLGFGRGETNPFISDTYNRIVPTLGLNVSKWFNILLSDPDNCPNPYIRLEMFRLLRLLGIPSILSQKHICLTFIQTISDIKPHRLYPSRNGNDLLFGAIDLYHVISYDFGTDNLQKIISEEFDAQLRAAGICKDKSEVRFLSNCIQLLGVFAAKAGDNPECKRTFIELRNCFLVFRTCIGFMLDIDIFNGTPPWEQFCDIVGLPPFRRYVVETMVNLTAAVNNYKPGNIKEILMSLRDIISMDLGICNTTSKIPSLLLSREVQCTMSVCQHSLLLKRLSRRTEDNYTPEDGEDGYSDISKNGEYSDQRYKIIWQLPNYDGDKDE